MALTTIPGEGLWIPGRPIFGPTAFSNSGAITGSTHKLAMMGRFFHKDRSTKSIRRICFRFGTVTKAGGSALTASLQDISTSAGPVLQPDGTQDQTVAIANADASFASNTWIRSGTLSADRSTAFGERLAFVLEYDGGGRLGADSVTLSAFAPNDGHSMPGVSGYDGASWANNALIPNVIFECSDGTFGTLAGSQFASAVNSHNYASNTAGADEYAMEFSLPFACKVDGGWAQMALGGDCEIRLYDGTSVMTGGTVTEDANTATSGSTRIRVFDFTAEVSLSASTTYRLAIRPTTTTALTAYSYDVSDANHFQAAAFGTSGCLATRVDDGSWSTTTTRRLWAGLRLSACDSGGGGGGPLIGGRLVGHRL